MDLQLLSLHFAIHLSLELDKTLKVPSLNVSRDSHVICYGTDASIVGIRARFLYVRSHIAGPSRLKSTVALQTNEI